MQRSIFWPGLVALLFAMLVCFPATLREWFPTTHLGLAQQMDFNVYYVAAQLVSRGQDSHIYDDAGTGVDPQERFASPETLFAHTAAQDGLSRIQLYVYPPALADLLVPLTRLSLHHAALAWRIFCMLCLLCTAMALANLLELRWRDGAPLLILIGMLCFRPVWIGLFFGQITLLLLLLWTLGVLCYVRGLKPLAAMFFALAALIKLTPLIVVLPLLAWRDWRTLCWLTSFVILLAGAMCWRHGIATPLFFFGHVMPAMSAGIPNLDNKTVLSMVQIVWHGATSFAGVVIPQGLLLAGKLLCFVLLVTATWIVLRRGRPAATQPQAMTLAAFAMLSVCLSPVSWQHAYVLGIPLLAVAWRQAFAVRAGPLRLMALSAVSIAMGGVSFTSIAVHFGPPFVVAYCALFAGVGLAFWSLSSATRFAPKLLTQPVSALATAGPA